MIAIRVRNRVDYTIRCIAELTILFRLLYSTWYVARIQYVSAPEPAVILLGRLVIQRSSPTSLSLIPGIHG